MAFFGAPQFHMLFPPCIELPGVTVLGVTGWSGARLCDQFQKDMPPCIELPSTVGFADAALSAAASCCAKLSWPCDEVFGVLLSDGGRERSP